MPLATSIENLASAMDRVVDERLIARIFSFGDAPGYHYVMVGAIFAEEKGGERTGQLAMRMDGEWCP